MAIALNQITRYAEYTLEVFLSTYLVTAVGFTYDAKGLRVFLQIL